MTPDDELNIRIGRVARAHVFMDNTLRHIHVALAGPGLAIFLTNNINSTYALVQDCRTMLAKAELDEPVREASMEVLNAALEANTQRNQVVHDMWMRAPEEGDDAAIRWNVHHHKKSALGSKPRDAPRDLAFLDEAWVTVSRAGIRVGALLWVVWDVLPTLKGSHIKSPEELAAATAEWVGIMQDRFDLRDNGGYVPHDDAPLAGR